MKPMQWIILAGLIFFLLIAAASLPVYQFAFYALCGMIAYRAIKRSYQSEEADDEEE